MRYDGTRATVRARFGRSQAIEVQHHRSGTTEEVEIGPAIGGHGGGDPGLIASFAESVATGTPSRTSGAEALESHRLAFASEESRLTGMSIDVAARRML